MLTIKSPLCTIVEGNSKIEVTIKEDKLKKNYGILLTIECRIT